MPCNPDLSKVDDIRLMLSAWWCSTGKSASLLVSNSRRQKAQRRRVAWVHPSSLNWAVRSSADKCSSASCASSPMIKIGIHDSLTAGLSRSVRAELCVWRLSTLSMQEAHRHAAAFSTGRSSQHTRCSASGGAGASSFVTNAPSCGRLDGRP